MAAPLTLKELSKLRLRRETLERWIEEAELEEIIRGCFVRILVGEKKGQRVYRICVVKGVEVKDEKDGAMARYKFGDVETNKHLQLEYGNVTKTFKMDYVSNSEFSQEEFNEWMAQMNRTNQAILTSKDVDRKVKRIKTFVLEKRNREAAESAKKAEEIPTTTNEAPTDEQPKEEVVIVEQEEEEPDIGIKVPAKRPKLSHFRPERPDLPDPVTVPAPVEALPTKKADGEMEIDEPESKDPASWTYEECYRKCTELTEKVETTNKALIELEDECAKNEQTCRDLARKVKKLEKGDDSEVKQEKKDKLLAELQAKVAELQNPYEEQKKELLEELKQKDEATNVRKIKYRDLRIDHEAIYRDMDKERKDCKGISQKKEREMHSLQHKIKEVNTKLSGHQTKLQEQQQALDVQDSVIDELQTQLKEEEAQQIVLQTKRRLQAEALGELTKLNKGLKQGIEELKLKYEMLKSDPDLLEAARVSANLQ